MNAIYSGPFITEAKKEFSNSQNANIQKWSNYINGSPNRQDYLEAALDWVSEGKIDSYMSAHRFDTNINDLKRYFESTINWASVVFNRIEKEMKGLNWGEFYRKYHDTYKNRFTQSIKN